MTTTMIGVLTQKDPKGEGFLIYLSKKECEYKNQTNKKVRTLINNEVCIQLMGVICINYQSVTKVHSI